MMDGQMKTIRRRRAATVLLLVVIAAAVGAGHVSLNRQLRDARAAETAAEVREARIESRTVRRSAQRQHLDTVQISANRRLVRAVERLESLRSIEAEALQDLERRTQEREAVAEELTAAIASVSEAASRAEQNESLIGSLDRCLDGATRASNALSVGDAWRAFDLIGSIEGACQQVGVVIGR